jgi:membrane-associated phospholipid phosphatase
MGPALSCAAVLARLDSRLLYTMRTRFHGPMPERIGRWLGRIGEYGAIWVVIGIVLAFVDPDNGEDWVVAGILGPVAIGLNFVVKVIVRRPRPVLEGLPPLGGAPSSLSFPSAHATSSFACATAMTRIAPEAAVLFVPAVAIAACRPYLGMHYPSDVLAGVVLGVGLGLIAPL